MSVEWGKKKIYPFPEALPDRENQKEGKKWEIGNSPKARVSIIDKLMDVPLGEGDYNEFVRAHEKAHVAFSPTIMGEDIEKDSDILPYILSLEDVRIQKLMRDKCGIDTSPAEPKLLNGEFEIPVFSPPEEVLLRSLSTMYTGNFPYIMRKIRGMDKETMYPLLKKMAEEVEETFELNGWTYETVKQLAKVLQNMIKLAKKKTEKEEKKPEPMTAEDLKDGLKKVSEDEVDGRTKKEILEKVKEELIKGEGKLGEKVPWGKMEIVRPPMPIRVNKHMKKGSRALDEGTYMKHIHRYCTDKRIFAVNRKVQGGTIAIDGSGSMHLTNKEVIQILEAAPGCTIALYGAENEVGWLKILAEKGKQVLPKDVTSPGGCNVIDLPVLEWLGKQSKPRLWICDGNVTGMGDNSSYVNNLECRVACLEKDVIQARNTEKAIKIIKDLKQGKKINAAGTIHIG